MSAPAMARDGAWYVGGDFGAMIVEDVEFDLPPTIDNALTVDHDYGYDAALFVGYDLGAFRLEAEAAYRNAGANDFTTEILLHNSSGSWHPPGTHDASGSTSALSFMINGLLDFGDEDGVSGFVGGGLGMARVSFNSLRASVNDGVFLDDSDTRFAWQLVAGVRRAVSSNIDVTLRYRFFNADNLDVRTFEDAHDAEGRFRSHSLLGGLTFNFGASPPPPPPPQ